jgi:hypothetical protein
MKIKFFEHELFVKIAKIFEVENKREFSFNDERVAVVIFLIQL